MILSNAIFVGRADAIDLQADSRTVIDLNDALAAAASDATEITVLGGYYSRDWLLKLFERMPRARRSHCRVRIAVGSDATITLPKVWEHMREVKSELGRLGYRNPQIAIVRCAPVHFHTKLFRFLRTTRPCWFIGSANPGSERHELMMRISGRHRELSNYVETVFRSAHLIDDSSPPPQLPSTLREFFLQGVLCHKPHNQRLFTFDAYKFSPEDRNKIDAHLGEGSGVEHATPRTEGFGFGLRSAVGMEDGDFDQNGETTGRVRFRDYGMDTLFGLWLPSTYANLIRASVREREAARAQKLRAIGLALAGTGGQRKARTAFAAYIKSMDHYLNELGIDAKPIRDRDAAFGRYLASRTSSLANEEFVARHARVMTIAPMVDIWHDPDVAAKFVQSFFDDLEWRAKGARKPLSVRSLLAGLGERASWHTSEDLQAAFAARLQAQPWNTSEWCDEGG